VSITFQRQGFLHWEGEHVENQSVSWIVPLRNHPAGLFDEKTSAGHKIKEGGETKKNKGNTNGPNSLKTPFLMVEVSLYSIPLKATEIAKR